MFSPLRSRDFRLLWLSQSASMLGDALVFVAVGIFVTRLTGQPGDVGIVLAAYSIPLVVLLMVGGVLADRLPRRTVIVATDLVRALAHGVLALLILTDAVRVWHMVIIGVVFGSAEAFFRPAYTGLLPQTVSERDIQPAQALGGMSREIAQFVSPALAAALVLGVGGAAVFALDSLTFVVSAVLVWRVRARSRGEAVVGAGLWAELREGWVAVRERGWVWATIAAYSAAVFIGLAPFFVLGAAVAESVYGSAAFYGYATAFWGAGTLSGALLGAFWRPQRPLVVGLLASTPWTACFALYASGPPPAVMFAGMTLSGVGAGLFVVWWETALAERIPPHLLSRVSAWDWLGSLAFIPLGYLLAGPAAEVFGEVRVLQVGGLVGSAVTALALLPASTRALSRTSR